MYQIYYSKKGYKIDVKPLAKVFKDGTLTRKFITDAENNPGEVIRYNNCYSFSTSRKALVEFGHSLKEKWIDELRDEINRFESIKI